MKISKVYKISGNVTVLMFNTNDSNNVINIVNDTLEVDPEEYKSIYVIDNDNNTVIELHDFFNEQGEGVMSSEETSGVSSGIASGVDLDSAGALFKGLFGTSKQDNIEKSIKSDSNSNVSMNINKR
jgi:hypothetical protein